MKIRFEFLDSCEIDGYQDKLDQFEKEFIYPLDNEKGFAISHGEKYSAFFFRMGKPKFLLAFDQDQLVGTICVVEKSIFYRHRKLKILYLSDLKVSKDYRGKNISRKIYRHLLISVLKSPFGWGWSLCYFIGMVGTHGDISRSFQGSPLEKIVRPFAEILIYFIPPEKLAALPQNTVCENVRLEDIFDLSSIKQDPIISDLIGIKDIIVENKTLFYLAHINIRHLTGADLIERLRDAGKKSKRHQSCCFALDVRRTNLIEWLGQHGISTSSKAVVGGFNFSLFPSRCEAVSINTDEI